jgi:hypothetical protein
MSDEQYGSAKAIGAPEFPRSCLVVTRPSDAGKGHDGGIGLSRGRRHDQNSKKVAVNHPSER